MPPASIDTVWWLFGIVNYTVAFENLTLAPRPGVAGQFQPHVRAGIESDGVRSR